MWSCRPFPVLATLSILCVAASCGPADRPEAASPETEAGVSGVVEITARGLEFDAPDEIPTGWVTFRLKNESEMTHFGLLERMPEGVGLEEQQEQVAPIFQQGMDLLNAGKQDEAMEAFGRLPEWFGEIVFVGGPGLVAPGRSAEATVYVEPGTYLLECYVKTDSVFHSFNPSPTSYGMVHEFTATGDSSAAPEPTADLRISISGDGGIEVDGEVVPGRHIVSVHFQDQKVHENFVGHDVHLVRLEDGTDVEALAAWMDWRQPAGLETPAPATFVGGINEMPAGETAYFTVTLEPGRYAWVSEVPDADEKGMLKTFVVPGEGA